MKSILRAISPLFLAFLLIGCVDIIIPNKYQVDAEVATPDLPKTTANLEPAAKAFDPFDIRGRREKSAELEKQNRELEARLKAAEAELQARSQPSSGAQLKILVGGQNHRSPEEDKDNQHFNIAGMTYDVPFQAPNELLDIQLLPRQLEDWNKLDEAKVTIQPDKKSAKYFFRGSRPAFIEYYTIILYR